VRGLTRWLLTLFHSFVPALLYLILFRWLREMIDLVRDLIGVGRRREELEDHRRGRDPRCIPKRCGGISPDVYRRADPMIYSQRYLREQGLAVTWDNPDIQLYRNGVQVSSSSLDAGTQYEIRAQIWNNSTDAPAVGLDVDFFFRDFGIGTALITIGSDTITLPIKGAPGHPAVARSMWTTPNTPGHYCVRVQLNWADDANPKNNLGQENTNVGTASSPAIFGFAVRNESTVRRTLRLVADAYVIPDLMDCRERPKKKTTDREHPELVLATGFIPIYERNADWTLARLRHGPDAHPVPLGWSVEFMPDVLDLDAGEARDVEVSITPPSDYVGQKTINVNAMHGTDLVGGVTLLVDAA
jgi:hypothetical protein